MQIANYPEGHTIIREVLTPDVINDFQTYAQLQIANNYLVQDEFGIGKSGDIVGDSLLLDVKAIIEEASGKTLYPTYSYIRQYATGADLRKHIDRHSCEVSCTLTIDYHATKPWSIFLAHEGKTIEIPLDRGEMLLYRGDKMPHWREPFEGKTSLHIFLHYVDSKGEFSNLKFDNRTSLSGLGRHEGLLKKRIHSLQQLAHIQEYTPLRVNHVLGLQLEEAHPFVVLRFEHGNLMRAFLSLKPTLERLIALKETFTIKSLQLSDQDQKLIMPVIRFLIINGSIDII